MNIILAEDFNSPLGSFVDKVKSKFPPDSVIYCSSDNEDEVIKRTALPPPLSKGWLIVVSKRKMSTGSFNKFDYERDTIIYLARDMETCELFCRAAILDSAKYYLVDNLNPSKEDLLKYIMSELGVNMELAEYIAKRSRYSSKNVVNAVDTLYGIGKLNKDIIKEYTRASADISFNQLFEYIIGQPKPVNPALKWNTETKHSKIVSLVRRYEHAPNYLLKYIISRFEESFKILDLAHIGELSLSNYKQYMSENRELFKDITEYNVKRCLESMEHVSYGKLYQLYLMYKAESTKKSGMLGLLALLHLSRK